MREWGQDGARPSTVSQGQVRLVMPSRSFAHAWAARSWRAAMPLIDTPAVRAVQQLYARESFIINVRKSKHQGSIWAGAAKQSPAQPNAATVLLRWGCGGKRQNLPRGRCPRRQVTPLWRPHRRPRTRQAIWRRYRMTRTRAASSVPSWRPSGPLRRLQRGCGAWAGLALVGRSGGQGWARARGGCCHAVC